MFDKADDSAAALGRLIQVIEELRKLDPKMDLGQVLTLLLIAQKPGIRTAELLKRTGLSTSTLSRQVIMMSERNFQNTPDGKVIHGLDLVTQLTDPLDTRGKLAATTRRGSTLVQKLVGILMKGATHNGSEARNEVAGGHPPA